jgi:hypothetical protein
MAIILRCRVCLLVQGFVVQKYLESNAAAGVALLNAFPPSPGQAPTST